MENNYSIEVIEMMCANDSDGNAQVTKVVPVEEMDEQVIPTISAKTIAQRESFDSWMTTNAATNWLLFGIMIMIFMFMIFKCD